MSAPHPLVLSDVFLSSLHFPDFMQRLVIGLRG
jgi:hypothetical protein